MTQLPDLKDLTCPEMEAFIADLGKERYRAKQIMKWIYRFGLTSFEDMTDLSRDFRDSMSSRARISSLALEKIIESRDGTKKALWRLDDGLAIESVLIREKNHWTLCISTQAGCAMGCAFCYTGTMGLKRNLRTSEIVDQVTRLRFTFPEGKDIKNIVMMGMGEPLANYENTVKAIGIITDDWGLAVSKRRVTVSTCGLVPLIYRLGRDTSANLAVSLNAADDVTRQALMPVNSTYPLNKLLEACRAYNMPRRRRITFEYIVIAGVNDGDDDAEKLARLLRTVRCKINLIPFNEFPGSPLKTPSEERVQAFRNILIERGYTTMVRMSKGSDILAACGQLTGESSPE
ncbi:MAG: 23S rRNA (adenine(2503)-C(2))-methyltransferase RlmN [Deltaproteobacteria bacterium]|nr:23S rRNA (adenine(2503)-C(2))-methyltransferase RlmN [Deltaproteobacteria bacterium]